MVIIFILICNSNLLQHNLSYIVLLILFSNSKGRKPLRPIPMHMSIQTYSPWIYFHLKEQYIPSFVGWYLNNGTLLYKKGNESNPTPIDPTGSNLPQGGWNDDTYWLDLPIDKDAKEKVKKGDLGSSKSYIHVKPMLGGTFTDLVFWFFYPFNGPGTPKVELINLSLGKIGEHVGNWEHLTLRISNFSGKLWSVYFSQHSKGSWVNAPDLEFQGGNKFVTYSALHGHPFYAKPGLSEFVMNTGERYVVVSAEYLGMAIVEPPWLNYLKKWCPKIDYNTEEFDKIEKLLTGKLKDVFKRVINGLPREVYGEDGTTGPMINDYWTGYERV
ncbi:hypothetical protein MKX03_025021 [Papaver bracteatum]|nr:hypothetical protein MKX03_025021 [Papaver bracteatum]